MSDAIGQLTALTKLEIWGNQLSSLPHQVFQLTALTSLELSYNQLSSLAPQVFQLKALTHINVTNNQLSSLPPQISQLAALTELFLHGKERRRSRPELQRLTIKAQEREGITLIVQGDYILGNKPMTHDHSIHIGGNVINSQVGQTMTNCSNMVQQQAPGELKDLLETLHKQVQQLIAELPEDKKDEAPQVAENLELLVKQATSAKPNRKWYSVSSEGLLEAAGWVKDFSTQISGTLTSLGATLGTDFSLPEVVR